MRVHMIDLPSPFAPLSEWQAFLREVLRLTPQNRETEAAAEEARREIRRLGGIA